MTRPQIDEDAMEKPQDFDPSGVKPRALFAFFLDGEWLHTHPDVGLFERWVRSPFYPPERSHVVKFEPTCVVSGQELARSRLSDLTGDASS